MKKQLSLFAMLLAFSATIAQKNITTEDVWKRVKFYASGVHGLNSMNDGKHYTTKEGGSVVKYNYATGEKVATLFSKKEIKENTGTAVNFSSYELSADETKVVLKTESEKIYRHSTRAKFYIYNLETKKLDLVADEKVRYATLSPNGKFVAFVSDNNLFVKEIESGKTTQITTDGEQNKIINGATDWVYEEEFAMSRAFFWSPGSNYIAFYRFDETAVPTFSMDMYGKGLYPTQNVFKYPKAGEANSVVTAHIYSVQADQKKQVLQDAEYEYIPRMVWTKADDELVIYTMNRHQNHLKLNLVSAQTGKDNLLYEEKDEAYIEIHDNIRFFDNGDFIWTSDKSGFNHIYLITKKGKEKQITTGDFDVIKFYGINPKTKTVFYQSNEVRTSERNVYSIKLNGKSKKRLSPKDGVNNAKFSADFSYFINTHSAYKSPPFVTLRNASGKEIRVLKNNNSKREGLKNYNISDKEFFTLTTAEGIDLSAWMMKPTNFDKSKKHPVLMFVYGGPGNQQVLNNYSAFNDMWYQTLISKGYIIVCVDNRGTGGKGRDFQKVTYQQLGKYEVQDQIASAKYLATLPFVDADRIGIWGWSYGGYMSSNCLFQGSDVFKMAIAVAPVTNWRFYDNIYTERYMRTPQENADGYDANSPINHVKKLKGDFLLIHGSADDNVHVQNSMRMAKELIRAGKQFQYFVYPDRDHSIMGEGAKVHIYQQMENFILEKL